MKLSFVIPAHNEELRLGNCLDAIMHELDRTLYYAPDANREVEIVVVNNASTDDTRGVALRYPSVKVVDEVEKGIVRARARGFAESTGEIVANVDADNVIPPGYIGRVFDEFERDPNLVCLTGPLVYFDLPGYQRFFVQIFTWFGFLSHLIFRALGKGAYVQGGNFVLRRDAWIRAGGFDRSIDFYGEDTDVARRIVRQGKVKFSFYLPILSSGRRLAKEGVLATGGRYALNYFWVIAFGRPFTKSSKDVRPGTSN